MVRLLLLLLSIGEAASLSYGSRDIIEILENNHFSNEELQNNIVSLYQELQRQTELNSYYRTENEKYKALLKGYIKGERI